MHMCVQMHLGVSVSMHRGTPSLLSMREIESAGRVSVPRLHSSGAISSHSSPLHLPQVALSSPQSTVCLLSYPIIMNMHVSAEPSVLMCDTGINS